MIVDDALAMVGSANLDVRSFNLNFELTLLMYGSAPVERLAAIHQQYIAQSCLLSPELWSRRNVFKRYGDRAISLLSPLL